MKKQGPWEEKNVLVRDLLLPPYTLLLIESFSVLWLKTTCFIILHYNYSPLKLVNFKMSQANLKNARNTVALRISQIGYTSNLTLMVGYSNSHLQAILIIL